PNGHHGNEYWVIDDGTGKAAEKFLEIPAVGKFGGPALKPFHEILSQQFTNTTTGATRIAGDNKSMTTQ
ncbi:MAG TPA: hypothetical protein PLP86_04445, partial [Armatimonadota bacterium]|nr:hypothetical protein [Armatimonadota bacterium]